MDFQQQFEQRQKDALAKITKLVKKSGEQVRFYIDDELVSKEKYLEALEAEGAYKLPFAYSKHTVTFYLLTKKYLAEGNKK